MPKFSHTNIQALEQMCSQIVCGPIVPIPKYTFSDIKYYNYQRPYVFFRLLVHKNFYLHINPDTTSLSVEYTAYKLAIHNNQSKNPFLEKG